MKARIADLGGTIIQKKPAEAAEFVASYTEKWTTIIRAAGIKME